MIPKGKSQGRNGGGQGRKRKVAAKGKTGKREPRRKSRKAEVGPTHKARERAATLFNPDLGVVFKDPLRVQIMGIATQRTVSPSEFAKESGCTLGSASYHFRVLREAAVLEIVEWVQVRGATRHMHKATGRALITDADFAQLGRVIQSGISGAVLKDLNTRVSQAMEAGTFDARDDSIFLWDGIVLDEVSWPEFIKILVWAYQEALELEVETIERRTEGKSKESIPATVAIAGFESPQQAKVKKRAQRAGALPRVRKSKGKRAKS